MIQPLWMTVWRFLKKLGIKPPYDPEIPLLGIYPEKTKIEKNTYISLFIAALFKIAIDGETVETVSDFIFWGFKITADGDCSHEIKRRLLLGGKVMTSLDNICKSRDITLPTKVRLVKAIVFPVVMYGRES